MIRAKPCDFSSAARGSERDQNIPICRDGPCRLIYNLRRLRRTPRVPGEVAMPIRSKWESLPTEAINPATLAIDKLPAADIVELMMNEDRKVVAAVQREKERIALGADMIAESLRRGGRDRLRRRRHERPAWRARIGGDAADVRHRSIARPGGDGRRTRRHIQAREGVEDNYEEGARAVSRLRPTKKDVVVGVSASGMTQFVRGALTRARKAGAKILFVTCDPKTELQTFVDLTIAPAVGPEVIAGSTRLKAGTATKMVLNMLTTDRDDPHRQDLRQPDGGRPHRIREAEGSRAAHRQHHHRPRLRRGRQVAASARAGT